ncbi:unnamed protein product [Gemmata massiliana]|uniref:Uncharacterized protein n=1 Tax=Gemmata massiliana TaxID=1210884 RepID=A0A6P2D7A2_9BACT|nr:hypothetical protein [Gemmata massiliana]VTR97029.1 unnamed protein product [Gemmata massiliana]
MPPSRDPEPVPLSAVIESSLNRASTPDPPLLAFKLSGRSYPTRSVRTNHPRGREGMMPELLTLCRELLNGLRSWPLYLWSPGPGTGKTSTALTLLDHYGHAHRGYSADVSEFMHGFADFAALPDLFRSAERGRYYRSSSYGCQTIWSSDLWGAVRRSPLLVIDDLRKPSDREQRLGDDHYGILKRILDERVARPLVITSNVDPWEPPGGGAPELVRLFDDRVADRIVCGTVLELAGDSRRRG